MKELILPISMIIICIIALIGMIFVLKKNENTDKKKKIDQTNLSKTAQSFVNVKDIRDIFLYTQDNNLISYIKVQPISIDLLSDNEKKVLARKLTEEFSEEDKPFKFLAVSRPVDITPLINEYSELINSSVDTIQKELLRNEIRVISEFSLSGEVVQREFYYMLWERESEYSENDLRKRVQDLSSKMEAAGIKCEILKQRDITKLCNLVNNPAFAAIEDTNIEATIPCLN